MKKLTNAVWDDNDIQFPRLLAEIRAAGLTDEQYRDLTCSMDMAKEMIDELLKRAEDVWEQRKRRSKKLRDNPTGKWQLKEYPPTPLTDAERERKGGVVYADRAYTTPAERRKADRDEHNARNRRKN